MSTPEEVVAVTRASVQSGLTAKFKWNKSNCEKVLEVGTNEQGCFIPLSHKGNHDGYFRKSMTVNGKPKTLIMFHRWIYEGLHGPLPENQELHHICGNRACFNPDHLQPVNIGYHKASTNFRRYRPIFDEAYRHWKETGCSGAELGRLFGRTSGTGARWIGLFKSRPEGLIY